MAGITRDLRFAIRGIEHAPGFALAVILTFALGVGANTAIFSVVKAVLLNSLPYGNAGRLVVLGLSTPDMHEGERVDVRTLYYWLERNRSFENISAYTDATGVLFDGGAPEVIRGMRVRYNFFQTLGVKLEFGRDFMPRENTPSGANAIILSHDLWVRRFAADPRVVGNVVRLGNEALVIDGVLPAGFRPLHMSNPGEFPSFYRPLPYDLSSTGSNGCSAVACLRTGANAAQARADLNAILRSLVREHPLDYPPHVEARVISLQHYVTGRIDRALWMLFAAVALLLLIASSNIANLLLVRAAARRKEIAIRTALGAGRARLIRQMLTESVMLALTGGALGAAVAWAAVSIAKPLLPHEIPRSNEIRVDTAVLVYTAAVSLLCGIVFGLVPAWRASRLDLSAELAGDRGSGRRRSRYSLRDMLVAVEIAFTLALAVAAGLFAKSFAKLTAVHLGFDPHNVLTMTAWEWKQDEPAARLRDFRNIVARVNAVRGVEAAAMASPVPLGHPDQVSVGLPGRDDAGRRLVDRTFASPGYFQVLRIPLLRGRMFTEHDDAAHPRVALVSAVCARALFPGKSAMGKQIAIENADGERQWTTVVGIVADVRQHGFDMGPALSVYLPMAQNASMYYSLLVRTVEDPTRMKKPVAAAIARYDPEQPPFHVQAMDAYVSKSLAARTFTVSLIGTFGTLALALAAVGVFGITAYAVRLRTREIAVRMALGAGTSAVFVTVLRRAGALLACGIAAGLAISLALNRLIASQLYGVGPRDPETLAVVMLVVSVVALGAAYLPARSAAHMDPAVALRSE